MVFQIKTEFTSLEDAIAYLRGDVTAELTRLQAVEDDEKPALLRKRDELLRESKEAKTRAADLESLLEQAKGRITELETQMKGQGKSEEELASHYRSLYEADQAKLNERLDAIEAERKAEREAAARSALKASALAELAKPNYGIINADHFYRLHGDRLTRDPDTGELYVDLGDYKRQTVGQFVEDVAQRPEEQHLFKAKGGTGNNSTGSGSGVTTTADNPWKQSTFNLTRQGQIIRENPGLAARLKAEAAVK